jgi:hypothetical protein
MRAITDTGLTAEVAPVAFLFCLCRCAICIHSRHPSSVDLWERTPQGSGPARLCSRAKWNSRLVGACAHVSRQRHP